EPLVCAAADPGDDALAVELSSQQLHWSHRLAPSYAALLNLADDHLEWHGDFAAYAEAKRRVWRAAAGASDGAVAVGNLDDPLVAKALAGLPGRVAGFTLAAPAPGQLGVVDGALVDAAFADPPVRLAQVAAVRPAGRHHVANAL